MAERARVGAARDSRAGAGRLEAMPLRRKLDILLGAPLIAVLVLLIPVTWAKFSAAQQWQSAADSMRTDAQISVLINDLETEQSAALGLQGLGAVRHTAALDSPQQFKAAGAVTDTEIAEIHATLHPAVSSALGQALAEVVWETQGPNGARAGAVPGAPLNGYNVENGYGAAVQELYNALDLDELAGAGGPAAFDEAEFDFLYTSDLSEHGREIDLLALTNNADIDQQGGQTSIDSTDLAMLERDDGVAQSEANRFTAVAPGLDEDVYQLAADSADQEFVTLEQKSVELALGYSDPATAVDQVVLNDQALPTGEAGTGDQGLVEAAVHASRQRGAMEQQVSDALVASAEHQAAIGRSYALGLLAGALLLLFLLIVLEIRVRRSVVQPMIRLTGAARQVADVTRADLERVADDDEGTDPQAVPTFETVPITTRDEIGDLGEAFNRVQVTAVRAAGAPGGQPPQHRRDVRQRRPPRQQPDGPSARPDRRGRARRDRPRGPRTALPHRPPRGAPAAQRGQPDAAGRHPRDRPRRRPRCGSPTWCAPRSARSRATSASCPHAEGDVTVAPDIVGDLTLMLAELLENAVSFSPATSLGGDRGAPDGSAGAAVEIVDHGLGMSAGAPGRGERPADPPRTARPGAHQGARPLRGRPPGPALGHRGRADPHPGRRRHRPAGLGADLLFDAPAPPPRRRGPAHAARTAAPGGPAPALPEQRVTRERPGQAPPPAGPPARPDGLPSRRRAAAPDPTAGRPAADRAAPAADGISPLPRRTTARRTRAPRPPRRPQREPQHRPRRRRRPPTSLRPTWPAASGPRWTGPRRPRSPTSPHRSRYAAARATPRGSRTPTHRTRPWPTTAPAPCRDAPGRRSAQPRSQRCPRRRPGRRRPARREAARAAVEEFEAGRGRRHCDSVRHTTSRTTQHQADASGRSAAVTTPTGDPDRQAAPSDLRSRRSRLHLAAQPIRHRDRRGRRRHRRVLRRTADRRLRNCATRPDSERLAAIVSGITSLAAGASGNYGLGRPATRSSSTWRTGHVLVSAIGSGAVLGVVTSKEAKLGNIAYEMTALRQPGRCRAQPAARHWKLKNTAR